MFFKRILIVNFSVQLRNCVRNCVCILQTKQPQAPDVIILHKKKINTLFLIIHKVPIDPILDLFQSVISGESFAKKNSSENYFDKIAEHTFYFLRDL